VKALKKKSAACQNLLRFDDAVEAMKNAYTVEKSQAISNELEEVESLKSNYDRYLSAEKTNDYAEALSCINHLVNKVPANTTLKLYKVECLAKTGETNEASHLLNSLHH
jgi:predicted Zn-dependent protease